MDSRIDSEEWRRAFDSGVVWGVAGFHGSVDHFKREDVAEIVAISSRAIGVFRLTDDRYACVDNRVQYACTCYNNCAEIIVAGSLKDLVQMGVREEDLPYLGIDQDGKAVPHTDKDAVEALKVAREVLRVRLSTVVTEQVEGRDPPLTVGDLIVQLIAVAERYSLTAPVTVDDPDTGLAVEVTGVEFWPMKDFAVLRTNGYATPHPSVYGEKLVKIAP